MNDNETVKNIIKVDGGDPDGVKIRLGELPEVRETVGVSYSGVITAPADYFEGKTDNGLTIDLSATTILVSGINTIELITNEFVKQEKTTVTGKLKAFSDLSDFGINARKEYSNKDLGKFLKMNRYYFNSIEANHQIVKNLNSFKAKIEREIEDSNDFKGNKKQLFEQEVRTDLKLDFKLKIPIYEGEAVAVFSVDINFDVSDARVVFWLESPELRELELKEANAIIDRELKRFKSLTIIRS